MSVYVEETKGGALEVHGSSNLEEDSAAVCTKEVIIRSVCHVLHDVRSDESVRRSESRRTETDDTENDSLGTVEGATALFERSE